MNVQDYPLTTRAAYTLSSTDPEPTIDGDGGTLATGTEFVRDNGNRFFWDGSKLAPVTTDQKLCQIADLLIEIRDLLSVD